MPATPVWLAAVESLLNRSIDGSIVTALAMSWKLAFGWVAKSAYLRNSSVYKSQTVAPASTQYAGLPYLSVVRKTRFIVLMSRIAPPVFSTKSS